MIKKVTQQFKNKIEDLNILDDVLNTIRFSGSIFFSSELASPWGMTLDNLNRPRFHISMKGDFFIGVDNGQKAVSINELDIVMLPHGDMHWIADKQESERIKSSEVANACDLGNPKFQNGTLTNKIICGMIHFDDELSHPIIASLPSVLHFSNIFVNDPIWKTIKMLEAQTIMNQSHKNIIVDRLTEILFMQLMHKYIDETESAETLGFFAGLRDSRVKKVLGLIHQFPEFPWTLKLLGDKVGMSRATLVRQFKATVDMPPMTYLSLWRMLKAYELLKYTNRSVEYVAESVGFSNSRTLNKAFQRHFEFTPKEVRNKYCEE